MTAINEADELIENWWRYFKDTKSQGRILSLEGRYVPERADIDYEEEPPPPARRPVDRSKAVKVEKIWISLPSEYKLPLGAQTFYRFALSERNFRKTCRICGVNPRHFDSNVKKAKLMVLNQFNRAS